MVPAHNEPSLHLFTKTSKCPLQSAPRVETLESKTTLSEYLGENLWEWERKNRSIGISRRKTF
jgi:hypothetical protein